MICNRVFLTKHLQYCMVHFLPQAQKDNYKQKIRKRDGIIHRKERDSGSVSCNKLYSLTLEQLFKFFFFFFCKHIKTDLRPTII